MLSTEQLVQIIITTVADNFGALLAMIALGAGLKIVLDIIFTALYNITTGRLN